MKRIFISILILPFLAAFPLGTLMAQTGNTALHAGKNGIYAEVFLQAKKAKIPLDNIGYAEIQTQKNSGNKWKTTVKQEIPTEYKAFVKNYRTIEKLFPFYGKRDDAALRKVWDRYRALVADNSKSARVIAFSLPVKLALGIAVRLPVSKAGTYACRLIVFDKNGKNLWQGNGQTVAWPAKPALSRLQFSGKKRIENGLQVTWKVAEKKYAGSYFVLYHQTRRNGKFERTTLTRWVNYTKQGAFVAFADTLLGKVPYAKYFVVSYDAYFNKGFVSDTTLVSNSDRQTFPMPENFTVTTDSHTGAVTLKWSLPDPAVVRSVDIYRGMYFNRPFTRIASVDPTTTTYTDENVKAGNKYYYFVQSSGLLNEKSLPTVKIYAYSKSNEKPIRPASLTGESIKNGTKLQWPGGNDFIKGYYVYRNGDSTDSLVKVSGFIPNTDSVIRFVDTSALLRPEYFYDYAVKAVSQNSVESDFSDTVKIRPGIKMTVPEPYGVEILKKGNAIWIGWENLFAHYNTVMGYRLKRVGKSSGDTVLLSRFISNRTNYFLDTTADITKSYRYGLQAVNVNQQESQEVWTAYKGLVEVPPSPLNLSLIQNADSLEIDWDPVLAHGIEGYKVYRYRRGSNPVLAGEVKSDQTALKIPIPAAGLWFFYVESYNNRHSSPPGDEVFIRIK